MKESKMKKNKMEENKMTESKMPDITCLAEGITYPTNSSLTGLNLNEIIVGGTGSGKSVSNAYSRLLHTNNSSVVVPVAKRALMEKFKGMFEERGYKTYVLDFAHPEKSDASYDPLQYVNSDQDAVRLARNLICATGRLRGEDEYWNNAAASVLAAEIIYVKLMEEHPTFADVIKLHRSMKVKTQKDLFASTIDDCFYVVEELYPGNQATQLWGTIKGLGMRTASCIISIVNNAVDKIFSEKVLDMVNNERKVCFREIGRRKTALFVLNSSMDEGLLSLLNIMYSDLFRELFEEAEEKPEGRLDVPVHIVCDDFACTGRINDFENYISIFRAAGISVTLLLQSESQLAGMYGYDAATTIINNCDTYVYLGGMDLQTCQNVSMRMNKPLNRVLTLPLETAVVFRRGMPHAVARRYQTFEDPIYKELLEKQELAEESERSSL